MLPHRVWSVAHSKLRRNLCASASDDGTAALWSGMGLSGRAVPPLNPARGCPVTCVDFSAEDENALLVACANGAAYVYDLRNRWAAAPQQHLYTTMQCSCPAVTPVSCGQTCCPLCAPEGLDHLTWTLLCAAA